MTIRNQVFRGEIKAIVLEMDAGLVAAGVVPETTLRPFDDVLLIAT